MILFKDPYRSALTRKGVVIAGARFTEAIDLDNAELEHPFELIGSLFEKDVNLRRVRSKFPIMLEGSNVAGFLDMNELELSGDLLIYFDHFYNVNLTAAHVGGQIDLTNSKVSGPLTMDGLQVGGLTMLGTESAEVELMGAHVSGALKLAGSKVGTVNCYGLEVEQQVWMAAESNNLVDCRIAKIKGDLYLGGQFTRDVDLSGAEIDGSLHFESARWDDYVTLVLRDAKVLGTIPGLADPWAPKLDLDGFTYRSVSEADQFKGWLGRLPNYVRQPYDQLSDLPYAVRQPGTLF
jgi:hypothetical protein